LGQGLHPRASQEATEMNFLYALGGTVLLACSIISHDVNTEGMGNHNCVSLSNIYDHVSHLHIMSPQKPDTPIACYMTLALPYSPKGSHHPPPQQYQRVRERGSS
jgi:hypothetical protein